MGYKENRFPLVINHEALAGISKARNSHLIRPWIGWRSRRKQTKKEVLNQAVVAFPSTTSRLAHNPHNTSLACLSQQSTRTFKTHSKSW